jgi:hypothetical protein
MTPRTFLKISPLFVILGAGLACSQEPVSTSRPESETPGSTSGPKSETNVKPTTTIQKEPSGRSSASEGEVEGSSKAAGAPGIEGKPGTQSGRSADDQSTPAPPQ